MRRIFLAVAEFLKLDKRSRENLDGLVWAAEWLSLAVLGAFAVAWLMQASTLTVCASGCDYANTALQTALNDAEPGDTILLESGFDYIGEFVLPDEKTCVAQDSTCYITVKTGVNSTGGLIASDTFPADNMRQHPRWSYHDTPVENTTAVTQIAAMAKLEADTNTMSTLRTVHPNEIAAGRCSANPCRSGWWYFQSIHFSGEPDGFNQLMEIGSNQDEAGSQGGEMQDTVAKAPHHFVFDRVYISGDQLRGMERCVQISAQHVTIKNSSTEYCKTLGSDGQSVWAINAGFITLTNNHFRGGTETFFTEGSGVRTQVRGTCRHSPAPTVDGCRLSAAEVVDMDVDDWGAVLSNGTEYSVRFTSIDDGDGDITWTTEGDPLPAAPTTTAIGATTDAAGYAAGTTTITLASAGTGAFNVNDTIRFANHTKGYVITSGDADVSNGGTITFTPALVSVGAIDAEATAITSIQVEWNYVTNNLTAQKNIFDKPLDERTPILNTPPTISAVTPVTSGGTLADGTYCYRVAARTTVSSNLAVRSLTGSEVCGVLSGSGGDGSMDIDWGVVQACSGGTCSNATQYIVYGRVTGAQDRWFDAGSATTFTDTGGAGTSPSGTLQIGSSASVFLNKNIFETKALDVGLIECNFFRRSWEGGQAGPGVLFKANGNTAGTNTSAVASTDSSVLRDVMFRKNHVSGAAEPMRLGREGNPATAHATGPIENVTIEGNLIDDAGEQWQDSPFGTVASITITSEEHEGILWGHEARQLTIQSNTIVHPTQNRAGIGMNYFPQLVQYTGVDHIFKDNLMHQGAGGVNCYDSGGGPEHEGTAAMSTCVTGTATLTNNVIAGATLSNYPATNLTPTTAEYEGAFIDYNGGLYGGNFRIDPNDAVGQTFLTASSTGGPIGADIDALYTDCVDVALSGDNRGNRPRLHHRLRIRIRAMLENLFTDGLWALANAMRTE